MKLLRIAFVVTCLISARTADAQVTQQQAQQLMNARPELLTQLRQRMTASGMSPQQVRDRLRAEGYDPTLLDAYLPGAQGAAANPNAEVFAAVQALGIADATDVNGLMGLAGLHREQVADAVTRPRRIPLPMPGADDSTLSNASGQLFGADLFKAVTTQFLPNLDGPVDNNYRIGPGDQLVLILTGDVELAHTLDVTREGFIVVPQVGQLPVASLMLSQVQDLLYARLGRVYSGVRRTNPTTHFSISVSKLRTVQVFVVGDATNQGSYRVSSAGTVLTALYAAGGPTDRGSMRRVELRRGNSGTSGTSGTTGNTVEASLDVYDYLLRGDASKDVRLQTGDRIFIPVHGPHVRLDGEVTRPGTYELKPGETIADLVSFAGGFSATAFARRLAVERVVPVNQRAPGGRDRTLVELNIEPGAPLPALALEAGDIVRVRRIADRVRNRVVVQGHVWQPGPQGLTQGLTLSEALRRAGGLKGDAHLSEVLVSRLREDSTRIQLRATARDTSGAVVTDMALREDDEVTVFSRTEFRPTQYVAIAGAVRRGGRYAYREGMTIRDLLLQAGGLVEGASVEFAEIARLPEPRAEGELARTERVPIDASYFFDSTAARATAPEVTLRPSDNVLFFRRADWEQPRVVSVSGEVKYPGQYTLRSKSDQLADIVQRAGGLTIQGNADAAYFSRLRAAVAYASATDSLRGTARVATDSSARIRIGVDLAEALHNARASDNLFLQAGDSLDVPPRRQTVEIRGEVNAPSAAALTSGKELGFYLDAAGGPTAKANTRRAYVVQPNGKVESRRRLLWVVALDPTPRAGSVVVVPAKDTTAVPGSALATASTLVQLLASLVTVLAITR